MMKPTTKLLKPGELSDEMQDYKIIELERYTVQQTEVLMKRQEEIIDSLTEIKTYIFNTQEKRIDKLENRIEKIEHRHRKVDKEKENQIKKKEEDSTWLKHTLMGSILTQMVGVIIMLGLLYFGLK